MEAQLPVARLDRDRNPFLALVSKGFYVSNFIEMASSVYVFI